MGRETVGEPVKNKTGRRCLISSGGGAGEKVVLAKSGPEMVMLKVV